MLWSLRVGCDVEVALGSNHTMHRTDRASLRRLQRLLSDPTRPDRDARALARVQVGLILARVEARKFNRLARGEGR